MSQEPNNVVIRTLKDGRIAAIFDVTKEPVKSKRGLKTVIASSHGFMDILPGISLSMTVACRAPKEKEASAEVESAPVAEPKLVKRETAPPPIHPEQVQEVLGNELESDILDL